MVVQRAGSTGNSAPHSFEACRTRYSGLPSTSPWTARVCAGVGSIFRPASLRTSCSGKLITVVSALGQKDRNAR